MTISSLELEDETLLRRQCFIAGQWVDAAGEETIIVTNPSSGSEVARVPRMTAADVARAIDAADRARAHWASRTAKERSAVLRKWHDLMHDNQEDLARIMTTEQGKPLKEARGEIAYAASYLEWFAEEAKRVYGDVSPGFTQTNRVVVLKQPIGVCAAITPWNFPAAMIARKAGPALATGCTMVLKPASQTPLTALALCRLAEIAGVPAGVLSCVTGSASEIGSEFTSNPLVRKLSFTGSTEVGRVLIEQCAPTVKRTSMELGGNAPFIVFDDADLDAAVEGAIASKYRNAGQTCVCANRFFVHVDVHDQFVERLTNAVGQLRVGDGRDDDVDIGPLIDQAALSNTSATVADAVEKGAKVAIGGSPAMESGTFFQPTVLTNVTPQMRVFREEIFGPVAPVSTFETEAEVLAMANNTEFGLAAYFYGCDLARVWRVAEGLEFGMVGINQGLISTETAPFGGMKQSGNGREGSRHGLDDYLETKYLCLGL